MDSFLEPTPEPIRKYPSVEKDRSARWCRDVQFDSSSIAIQAEQYEIQLGDFHLGPIDLQVSAGESLAIQGRSGSGKTTLLESFCGLRVPSVGRLRIAGDDVTYAPPASRRIGYVPQDLALFPTMTVRQQLGFALEVRGANAEETATRVQELAELLRIASRLDRLPETLSGGEAQRVAIGRALAADPVVLCLDEPLTALDDALRTEIVTALQEIRQQTGVAMIVVTHRSDEAAELADRVLRLGEP